MCLAVAGKRLDETDTLLVAGSVAQAAGLFSFAVEEFGKAVLLRGAYDGGADPAQVHDFYEHAAKIRAAASRVDPTYLRRSRGPFQPSVFQGDVFDTGGRVDLAARLSGLYVDWKDNAWTHGVPVDAVVLERSSKGLRAAIAEARMDWTM